MESMADLYCDICGKAPVRAQILLEGAKLLACGSCMRGGKILHRFIDDETGAGGPGTAAGGPYTVVEATEEIIEEFGKILRSARERIGLPLSVVAERIREKESYLHAIEGGRLVPTLEVARKLEKELGVKLIERTSATVAPTGPGASKAYTPPTLADMVDVKKKKK
jgi:putative transcription factor